MDGFDWSDPNTWWPFLFGNPTNQTSASADAYFGIPDVSNAVQNAATTVSNGVAASGQAIDDAASKLFDALPSETEVGLGILAIIIILFLILLIMGKVDAL